jgi:hypothetical protein
VLFVNFLSPYLEVPACPSTPKIIQAKERIPTLPSTVFTFGFTVESIKELGGASTNMTNGLLRKKSKCAHFLGP